MTAPLPYGAPIGDGHRNGDIVGILQIAERLGVAAATVHKWRIRARDAKEMIPMPTPNGYVSTTPWWTWDRVAAWARKTGRLR